MYIDEDVLKSQNIFLDLENKKKKIVGRFNTVSDLFDIAKSIKVSNDYVREIFLPCIQGWTDEVRFKGVFNQADAIFEKITIDINEKDLPKCLDRSNASKDFIIKFLSMMGGFNFFSFQDVESLRKKGYKFTAVEDFRLLSNIATQGDYLGDLKVGRYSGINSHFTDNTYVMEYVDFIKNIDKTPNISNIAIHYPTRGDTNNMVDERNNKEYRNKKAEIQQENIQYRFPLKFLWMWAKKDSVIHPLSLRASKSFLDSVFMEKIFLSLSQDDKFVDLKYDENKTMGNNVAEYAKNIIDARFDFFQKIWIRLSQKIMDTLGLSKSQGSIHEISRFISLLTLGETNMKNIELLKTHKQIILYGVPGTGKTHSAKELIKKWINEKFQDNQEKKKQDDLEKWRFGWFVNEGEKKKKREDKYNKEIQKDVVWEIMQFHPNTTYQDFIGGIVPKIDNETLLYELRDGKFKEFCEYANKTENRKKPFVFIIDEINRANLSEVLGELLYALEYRDEEITIPNFDEPFVIPSNVYIIGTMNNVDKSLSTFDLALRRRFGFYEVGVDCNAIKDIVKKILKILILTLIDVRT